MIMSVFKQTILYLDNCCFNRPYDNQSNERIRLETEAKMYIQDLIKQGEITLAWSFILDFENSANPVIERKKTIAEWRNVAAFYMAASDKIRVLANDIQMQTRLKSKDSLHIASAIAAKSKYFLTTDRKILKSKVDGICIVNPVDFVLVLHEEN